MKQAIEALASVQWRLNTQRCALWVATLFNCRAQDTEQS
jgi:hypothetical protein